MSLQHGIAALLLPFICQRIPNPLGVRWILTHGDDPMPPDVLEKAKRISSVVGYVQLLAEAVGLLILVRLSGVSPESIGMRSENWIPMGGMGIIAGCACLVPYILLVSAAPPDKNRFSLHPYIERPPSYWIPLSIGCAVSEEVWRAFCLVTLRPLGFWPAMAIVAVAFGLAHPKSLATVVSATLMGLCLAAMFILTHSLVVPAAAHAAVNVGMIWLVRHAHRRAVSFSD